MKLLFKKLIKFYQKKKYNIPLNCNVSLKSKLSNVNFEGDNFISKNVNLRNIEIGRHSYISNSSSFFNVKIERYSSIGSNVKNIIGIHPSKTFVSTHPSFYSLKPLTGKSYVGEQKFIEEKFVEGSKYSVVIGNDVWIGSNVLISEGITIGDGAIVAAGCVVTKDVPNYAIVGGIPSKIIKYRFEEEEINFLNNLKWWDKDEEWIENNAEYFEDIKILKSNLKG